jgi:hypothetical protein
MNVAGPVQINTLVVLGEAIPGPGFNHYPAKIHSARNGGNKFK